MKRAGKLDQALRYYKDAMDLEPDNSVFQYNTGVLFNIKSDYNQAVSMLEKSIENNKENVYAYLALGDALERQKEIKKAIYVYRDLMSLDITVHGLKEKLFYLEGVHEENMRKQLEEKEEQFQVAKEAKEVPVVAASPQKPEQNEANKKINDEKKLKEKMELEQQLQKEKDAALKKAEEERRVMGAKLQKEKEVAALEAQRLALETQKAREESARIRQEKEKLL